MKNEARTENGNGVPGSGAAPDPSAADAVVTLENVTKRYASAGGGKFYALKNLSLRIRRGVFAAGVAAAVRATCRRLAGLDLIKELREFAYS